MANYEALKTAIRNAVYENGNNEITGQALQDVLKAIVNSLGAGYQFTSVATTETEPGTPDSNVMYIAGAGTYPNFGGTVVPRGSLGIFRYNGEWNYTVLDVASWADASNKLYYNTQAGNVAAKTIQADGFTLQPGGWLKVHFDHANTAANSTLNVNNTGAHIMTFNGRPVSATNSWKAGETVAFYYDNYGVGIWRGIRLVELPDFLNVNDLVGQSTPFASASAARSAIPQQNRKAGLNITYLLTTGENTSQWVQDMFIGDDVSDWGVADNWKTIGPVSVSQNTETGNIDTEVGLSKVSSLSADKLIELSGWGTSRPIGLQVGDVYYNSAVGENKLIRIKDGTPDWEYVPWYDDALYLFEGALFRHSNSTLLPISEAYNVVLLKAISSSRPVDLSLGEIYYNTTYRCAYIVTDDTLGYRKITADANTLFVFKNQLFIAKLGNLYSYDLLPLSGKIDAMSFTDSETYLSKSDARSAIPIPLRLKGITIMYKLSDGSFYNEQFNGDFNYTAESWLDNNFWKEIQISGQFNIEEQFSGWCKKAVNFNWQNGYVNSSGIITASEESIFSQPIVIKPGELISYKSVRSYSLAVNVVNDNTPVSVGDNIGDNHIIGYGPEEVGNTLSWKNNTTNDVWVVVSTLAECYEISVYKYNSQSIIANIVDNIDELCLEIGSISGGKNIDNPARARSKGYVHGLAELTVLPGYVCLGYFAYTKLEDGSYIYTGWYDHSIIIGEHKKVVIPSDGYVKFIFRKEDNSNFSEYELNKVFKITRSFDIPTIENISEGTNKFEKLSVSNWLHAYVSNALVVTASSITGRCSQPILLYPGDILHVETTDDYYYPVVIVDSNSAISVGDTITPEERIVRPDNESMPHIIYIARKQCYAIITANELYNRIYIIRKQNIVNSSVISRYQVGKKDADLLTNYYITSNNLWAGGAIRGACLFAIYPGSMVEITANDNYYTVYALLKAPLAEPIAGNVPEFEDKSLSRHTIAAGTTLKFNIEKTCYLYVYHNDASDHSYWPKEFNIICPLNNYSKNFTVDNADIYLNKGIGAENDWRGQHINVPASCVWNVKAGDKITIKASSALYTIVAFIASTTGAHEDPVIFANNTNSRIVIPAGETQILDVQENCMFYTYLQADSGGIYFPEQIFCDSNSNIETENNIMPNITRFAINLVKKTFILSGIDNYGRLITKYDSIATEQLPIHIGDNWYQTAKYLHCCCYVIDSDEYKFCASKVVFLTEKKTVDSIVQNITEAIEIPTNARFAVVEFPKNTNHHFVSINNQSLLKTYSEYSENELVADVTPNYGKIKNSAAAVSHMIDIALDYTPFTYLGMGYGDIATAFDDIVEPVESEFPDTSPLHYSGEKLQMNCSTFVMLCLQGIFYKNSRYFTPDGINVGDGYIFDDQAEYNYHYTKAPYQYIFGANWGKMYANKLAKYAFDRGLLYMIKPDLSNIEAGDVLFDGQSVDNNFFMNIGHTMFVSDVEINEDGSKRVTVFETASADNRVIVYGDELWGARFPLPNRTLLFEDIVNGFTPITTTVTVAADTESTVGTTLHLTKPVTAKHHYTLYIKGSFPETVNVGIKSGTTKIEIARSLLYKRGDGVNIKHFNVYMNSSLNIDEFTIYIKSSEALTSETISIESIKMSEGWHIL